MRGEKMASRCVYQPLKRLVEHNFLSAADREVEEVVGVDIMIGNHVHTPLRAGSLEQATLRVVVEKKVRTPAEVRLVRKVPAQREYEFSCPYCKRQERVLLPYGTIGHRGVQREAREWMDSHFLPGSHGGDMACSRKYPRKREVIRGPLDKP